MRKEDVLNARRRSALVGLVLSAVSALALPVLANGANVPALLDDFSDAAKTSSGIERILVDDSSVGGHSALKQAVKDGVLSAEGEIVPARGQPGWVSMALAVAPTGEAVDLSQYEGVKIRIRVTKGNLSLSANSTDVTNFDYHSFSIGRTGGEFKEVRIPFNAMKRMWSEQTQLNPKTIQSFSLVAADMQKGTFAYDVDEVSFY